MPQRLPSGFIQGQQLWQDFNCACGSLQYVIDMTGCMKTNCKATDEALAELIGNKLGLCAGVASITPSGTTGAPRTFEGISTQTQAPAAPKRNGAPSSRGSAWAPFVAAAGVAVFAL
ncbi:hypothetical protein FA15DRAFT_730826 [Coprinopsis marcescibilis]|uniref:Extracellular membrane protein CFEM domain-containing protein n=1 Tax=Coprinopsis marcescibilis TaxID=230819 RepID=A0A5C3KDQ5_COPMA|nr:hypothetical protein FA15DRAFT_730826 [Coprinopsis marcescibilis]